MALLKVELWDKHWEVEMEKMLDFGSDQHLACLLEKLLEFDLGIAKVPLLGWSLDLWTVKCLEIALGNMWAVLKVYEWVEHLVLWKEMGLDFVLGLHWV